MREGGQLRTRLSEILTGAYGRGLLSEDTFAFRLQTVLNNPILDQHALVGDLAFRAPTDRAWVHLTRAATTVVARAEAWFGHPRPAPPAVLGLDWSGVRTELSVGRSPDNDVVLSDASISRRHARLFLRDGAWIVQDLRSTNGTAVNNQVVGRCEVRPGDRLRVGDLELLVD